MRLFGKVDGTINADDRAEWLTPPFGVPPAAPPLPSYDGNNEAPYRRQPGGTREIFTNYRRLFGQGDDYV